MSEYAVQGRICLSVMRRGRRNAPSAIAPYATLIRIACQAKID
jgi:hypothetical protein